MEKIQTARQKKYGGLNDPTIDIKEPMVTDRNFRVNNSLNGINDANNIGIHDEKTIFNNSDKQFNIENTLQIEEKIWSSLELLRFLERLHVDMISEFKE